MNSKADEDGLWFYVSCESCGAESSWVATEAFAADKWNTRTPTDRDTGRREEREAVVRELRSAADECDKAAKMPLINRAIAWALRQSADRFERGDHTPTKAEEP